MGGPACNTSASQAETCGKEGLGSLHPNTWQATGAPPSMRVLRWREINQAAARLVRKPEVTLFWDGGCPLCRKEIAFYKWLDASRQRVDWVDINADPRQLAAHNVALEDAMTRIHGIEHGKLLVGVPAFVAVWERLPYWSILPPLLRAMPWAMPAVEYAYAFWAKRRLGISTTLRRLETQASCRVPPPQ